jgi:excisionase family DNA binding protein
MLEYPRIYEHIEVLESLHHEHFSVEELADVLGISPSVIHAAVRRGELKGFTAGHRIVDIRRSDALEWLNERAKP